MAAARLGLQISCRVLSPSSGCYRAISSASCLQAGQKWRTSQGQAKDGISYGSLTDLPDWSYADGRPAPETKRRQLRMRRRLDVAARIDQLLSEVKDAKDCNKKDGNSS